MRDQITSMGTDTAGKSAGGAALRGALGLAAIGLSGFWLARAVVIFTTPESVWVAPLPVGSAAISARDLPALDTDFNAFNRALPLVDEGPAVIGEDAPETTLNLTLKGHIAGPGGIANLQTPDRKQNGYRVGDTVLDGVTLEAINPGFVIISRNGQLERLTFDRDSTLNDQPAPRSTSSPATSPATARPDPLAARRAQGSGSGQNQSLSDVVAGDLLRNVSLNRVMDGKAVLGYRVSGRGGTDLSQFGLQDGDVVTTVNGRNLTKGRPDIADLMEDMSRRDDATIIVLRDGAPVTVRIGN